MDAERYGISRDCPNVLTLQMLFLLLLRLLLLLRGAIPLAGISLSFLLRTPANHGLEVALVLLVKASGVTQGILFIRLGTDGGVVIK